MARQNYAKINDWLFVGNHRACHELQAQVAGVIHIWRSDYPEQRRKCAAHREGVSHLEMNYRDGADIDASNRRNLEHFIGTQRKPLLVHCHDGMCRSPLIASYALAMIDGIDLLEARHAVEKAIYEQRKGELCNVIYEPFRQIRDMVAEARRWNYDGYRLQIGSHHEREICREVIKDDCYQIDTLPDNARVVVDLGASFGPFALMANRRWPHATIYAYEPTGRRYGLLLRNVKHAANIIPVNAGIVGDVRTWIDDLPEQCNVQHNIAAASIMSIANLPSAIDVLKIDIEGCEYGVLAGMMAEGNKPKHIRGEWHFWPHRIREILEPHGYRCTVVEQGEWNYFTADSTLH